MDLPGAGGLVPEEALEELDRCRHHERRIPVLTRQPPPHLAFRRVIVWLDGRMMFEHSLWSEDLLEDLCGLVYDTRVGDGVDDPLQPVPVRVLQREGQRASRLSASGRHR